MEMGFSGSVVADSESILCSMVLSLVIEKTVLVQRFMLLALSVLISLPAGTNIFTNLEGIEKRFPFNEFNKVKELVEENPDCSEVGENDVYDSDPMDEDEDNEPEDHFDEDFDDDFDDDSDIYGDGGSDDDDDDDNDSDDTDTDDDDDDDDEDEEEDDEDEDEEMQSPPPPRSK